MSEELESHQAHEDPSPILLDERRSLLRKWLMGIFEEVQESQVDSKIKE